jgi:hypothetical protein
MSWANLAEDLAVWTWQRMVNRADCWGGYNAISDRERIVTRADGATTKLGASLTRPAVSKRGQVFLTFEDLEQHHRGTAPEHIVGLHAVSSDNLSRWGAVDIDWHGERAPPPRSTWPQRWYGTAGSSISGFIHC